MLVLSRKIRLSYLKTLFSDSDGNIHQFTHTNKGDNTWHWAGRTGKDQAVDQRLKGNNIPQDVIKHFNLNPKKVKKL